jgi:hypothetical protein
MWVCAPMSGQRPSPRVFGPTPRTSWRRIGLLFATSAAVGVLLLSVMIGNSSPGAVRANAPHAGLHELVAPADFELVNLSANNTTVDVSMDFNISVDVVNLAGGALNASNYTFVWTGLPAFVPGNPGSGCYGANPGNNSSVLNCTAAAPGTLTVSVTATNITGGPSNTSATLSITVNPLPTITAFTVSSTTSTLGTQIWFNASVTGGTGPYTFAYTGLPIPCSGSNASFSCTPTRAGLYLVNVTAVDSYGFTSAAWTANVTVKTAAKTSTTSTGIGTTGWGIVIGILVVGLLATLALLLQARREERAGQMGTEEVPAETSSEMGGQPPLGGTPPPGPPG